MARACSQGIREAPCICCMRGHNLTCIVLLPRPECHGSGSSPLRRQCIFGCTPFCLLLSLGQMVSAVLRPTVPASSE
jgi:hypothetical protein